MHYYKFNIGDYARSTRHLSNEEDLAYRRLIDMYYENEAPIPLETQWVARRIRVAAEVVEIVLQDMFERTEDGWKHARCEADIADYHKSAQRNRENGKRGGRPKSVGKKPTENPVGSQSDASGNPVVTLTTNHKPLTTNPDILSNESMPETDVSDTFDPKDVVEVWNELALKLGKPKVRDLTPERRQLLKARMAQYALDDFVVVFNNIERSPFLRGDHGWRGCTFDWVFKKSNFQKILEGNYND